MVKEAREGGGKSRGRSASARQGSLGIVGVGARLCERVQARVSAAVRRLGCRSDGPRPLPSAGPTAKAPASPMDAAQERLQALSHTQQALMDKIKALDELDQAGGEPLSCALSPCPHAEGRHARAAHAPQRLRPPLTDHGEQRIQEVNTVRLRRAARARTSLLYPRDAAARPLVLPGLTQLSWDAGTGAAAAGRRGPAVDAAAKAGRAPKDAGGHR